MHLRVWLLPSALIVAACPEASNETAATNPTASATETPPGTSGEPPAGTSSGETGVEGTSSTGGVVDPTTTSGDPPEPSTTLPDDTVSFITTMTEGGGGQCDVWLQDCVEGEKCAAYADDGSEHWNSTKCVPVVENPAQPGEACKIEDGVASGIDNCDKGSFCWYMDYNTLEGTCIAACTGSPDDPKCPDNRACDISNDGTLLLCLETCDPLTPSCPPGQLCFGGGGSFICDLDNSGDGGAYGDPCAFVNSCNYGLFCNSPEGVPGCDNGSGCCSEFCDLTADPVTCTGAPMQTCEPWWDPGTAPPGYEDVGYCTIPQ